MASQQAVDILLISDIFFARCSAFATFAIVHYDWLIKLDEEIHCFWAFRLEYKLNVAALLYGLSRYPMMACRINYDLQIITSALYLFIPPTLATIRVYALLSSKRIMAIPVFLLLFMPILATWVVQDTYKTLNLPGLFISCSLASPSSSMTRLKNGLSLATVCCNIAGDFLVLVITWFQMYASYRAQREVLHGSSLMRVMLYNGSVYYITIIGVNVLNMVLQAVPNIYLLPDADIAASVTIPLTTVLISRFILDLQQAAGRTAATPSAPSQVTSLDFATMEHGSSATNRGPGTLAAFITSMGTDVHMGLYDDEGGTEDVWPRGHGDRDEIAMVDTPVGLERDRNA